MLCVLLNPIFVSLFVVDAVKAIFSKNVAWTKIERANEISLNNSVSEETDEVFLGENNG